MPRKKCKIQLQLFRGEIHNTEQSSGNVESKSLMNFLDDTLKPIA